MTLYIFDIYDIYQIWKYVDIYSLDTSIIQSSSAISYRRQKHDFENIYHDQPTIKQNIYSV